MTDSDVFDLFGGSLSGQQPNMGLPMLAGMTPANWPWPGLAPRAYDIVVADPPWRFILHNEATGGRKSPQAHYQCRDIAWIQHLPVGLLARPDALLMLWGTWPMLDAARATLGRWGFTYVSGGSWAKRTASGKLRMGPGYVIRSASEFYLIGKVGAPAGMPSLRNHVDGLAREHSRKPDEFYAELARCTPGRRRCDLFARETRPGFEGWGDEVLLFDDDDADDAAEGEA